MQSHSTDVTSIAFSPSAAVFASADRSGTIKVWDLSAKRELGTLASDGWANEITFSCDGHQLLCANESGTIRRWSVPGLESLKSWKQPFPLRDISLLPDGTELLATSTKVAILDATTGKVLRKLREVRDPSFGFGRVSPDGRLFATDGIEWGSLKLFGIQEMKELCEAGGFSGPISSVAFSPDNQLLAGSASKPTIIIWEISTAG